MPKQPLSDHTQQITLIAGEASGDLHAANLVRHLKAALPNAQFSGIGGQHMQSEGVELISDLARFGVTGIVEVLKHIKTIKKAYRAIQKQLQQSPPDLLILVDYPGFNLRLADYAKKHLNLKIIYYISPQLWAWKPGRIKRIQASVDHMAVIFPFEKAIYENANVPVSFVGHPLTAQIHHQSTPLTKAQLNLPINKRLLAMLPGSRINEVDRHMPVFYHTIKQLRQVYPDLDIVIPVANTLSADYLKKCWPDDNTLPCHFIENQKAVDVANLCDAIVVASGTASLECALLEKPMCIIYKVGFVSYLAASVFLRVQYIGLCNLLMNQMTVPELLQYDFNPNELTKVITQLLDARAPLKKRIQTGLKTLKQSLSSEQADCSLPDLVLSMLEREKKLR